MKMEIERVSISSLLKLEVRELAEEVITIVQKHDDLLVLIEPVFNLLVAKRPAINKLNAPYGVDPVRLQLKPIREKLGLKASAIKLHLRVLSKTTEKSKLHVIQTAIDRHLRYLNKSKNVQLLNQKITGFIDDVETNAELSSAMREFGFMEFVEDLELSFADVRNLSGKRVRLLSERPQETSKQLMDIVYGATDDLFQEIEMAQLRNPEADFAPLVNEINQLIEQFRNAANRRDANNKRKAMQQEGAETEGATSETDASATETSPKEEQPSTEGSDNSSVLPTTYIASIKKMDNPRIEEISSNGNGSSNGTGEINLEQLAQKKTVAMPAKQKQPSDKNGKA